MSYQVLARKWRPRLFGEMVGQEHVVRALTNALDQDRLHHAYLFTGTRGVGKTTLARIFAKSLNCETGVSSNPCGECGACREIDEGRFVDLLEVDAASRTKVDQTRELLENVPYAPARGRYKVYLIDEVHMFSTSSFNALLKTLEEPPPHVKFLLATTDPQRVPVTVLSRCLQFNLKRLPLEQISRQLQTILEREDIEFDGSALNLLALFADGSMRDGLSLLDQAISYGAGKVRESDVNAMLGSVARNRTYELLTSLSGGKAADVMEAVAEIAEMTPDFSAALQDLLAILHRTALFQAVPDALGDDQGDKEQIESLAERMTPEDVQLYYQIGLMGQRDLPFAPDPRSGFEMTLLRMLAFKPVTAEVPAAETGKRASTQKAPNRAAFPDKKNRSKEVRETTDPNAAPAAVSQSAEKKPGSATQRELNTPDDWHALVADLRLGGIARQLANNCMFDAWDGTRLRLKLDPAGQHLRVSTAEDNLLKALRKRLGEQACLDILVEVPAEETPAQREAREKAERQQAAEASLAGDEVVEALQETFGARVVPDSVKPIGDP